MKKSKRRLISKEKNDDKSDKSLKFVSSLLEVDEKPHLLRQLRIADPRTPLDFDEFIPRMCLEWGILEPVFVKRIVEEDDVAVSQRKLSTIKKARNKSKIKVQDENFKNLPEDNKTPNESKNESQSYNIAIEDAIVIKAYYDSRDKLVKLSIIGCPIKIPQKLIRALGLCMPFHSALTQLTIKKGGLSCNTIYEIHRLLPHSNLTNICLDDSYISEGNYYMLLKEITQLSYLSLSRCKITDEVCEKITRQLMLGQPASNTLHILELASNMISNKGATFLGQMLRSNRRLQHLNLAGNNINDIGVAALLSSLMQFRLLDEEIKERKGMRLNYLRNKQSVYDKCLDELMQQKSQEVTLYNTSTTQRKNLRKKSLKRTHLLSTNSNSSSLPINLRRKSLKRSQTLSRKSNINSKSPKKSQNVLILNDLKEYAKLFTKRLIGEFMDPFCPISAVLNENIFYAEGNLVLCSLNLAYNNLHFPSVKKLAEVMNYQHAIEKTAPSTGLMRIVLNGNNIPERCDELDRIELHFKLNRLEKVTYSDMKQSLLCTPKVNQSALIKPK